MTAQWPRLASLETGLHANRYRHTDQFHRRPHDGPGSLLARHRRLPAVGKMRRSDGAIQNDPATRDRTDYVRGPKRARRAATTR
jgi:hypothetical protein